MEVLLISVLWSMLFIYLIGVAIDFGGGLYSTWYSAPRRRQQAVPALIKRLLGPMSKTINVFLVFFVVGLVVFFPDTAYYYGTALLIPANIAIVLLALRETAVAFGSQIAKPIFSKIYAASGLALAVVLATVLVLAGSGTIQASQGQVLIRYDLLLASPYFWSVVILAISSVLFIAATFLAYYAHRSGENHVYGLFRRLSTGWGMMALLSGLTMVLATSILPTPLRDTVPSLSELWTLSMLCFILAQILNTRRQAPGAVFLLVVEQYALAFYGYGYAHLPYLLYPYVTIYSGVVHTAMAKALLTAFVLGILILLPSLYLLLRLLVFDKSHASGR